MNTQRSSYMTCMCVLCLQTFTIVSWQLSVSIGRYRQEEIWNKKSLLSSSTAGSQVSMLSLKHWRITTSHSSLSDGPSHRTNLSRDATARTRNFVRCCRNFLHLPPLRVAWLGQVNHMVVGVGGTYKSQSYTWSSSHTYECDYTMQERLLFATKEVIHFEVMERMSVVDA